MDDTKDLLNLCRLNLMEEHIVDSPGVDRDATLKAIDFRKRRLAIKISLAKLEPGVMERHIEDNTVDGVYLGSEEIVDET